MTYIASAGEAPEQFEIRYEDENIWLTQKMLARLYGVETHTINYHLKKVFEDAELSEDSVIRKFRITAAEIAKLHAETEFEKYRVVQDRRFLSDYDRHLLELEEEMKEYNPADTAK